MKYNLPILPYTYEEFEPYIDSTTMFLHYNKHHQSYVNNINSILRTVKFTFMPIEKLILSLNDFPKQLTESLKNNAGGYINHNLFWKGLKLHTTLEGSLKKCILDQFHSTKAFIKKFNEKALSLFGSGWIWLVVENNCLSIVSTSNQDNPLMGEEFSGVSGYPLFGLDLWEHAYYLKYQNRRIEYVESFWNILNWDEASIRFNFYINNKNTIKN